MRHLTGFLELHKYRISVTFLVSLIYVYFWFYGPLEEIESINLGGHETRFLIPRLISDETQQQHDQYGILQDREELPWYIRIVGYNKKPASSWNLIADAHHNPALKSDVGVNLLSHAKRYVDEEMVGGNANLKPALDMYYSELLDTSGSLTSLYLESADVVKDVKGYAGPITLSVILNMDGTVSKVQHVSSIETASYLEMIADADFYQQFNGQSLTEGEFEIDAVSGATISTQAMARTVTGLIQTAEESPLSSYMEEDTAAYSVRATLSDMWIVHSILITGFFIFGWQRWFKKSKKIIFVSYLLSVGYIGLFLNNSFTYVSFIHPFMGVTVSVMVVVYATLVLMGAIWDNNTYCKYVCPYGNAQRLMLRLIPKVIPGLRKKIIFSTKWLNVFRFLLTGVLITGIIAGERRWSNFELFPDLFGPDVLSLWFWLSLFIIVVSGIYPMLWCRLLCPTGAILDFLSGLVQTGSAHKKRESQSNMVVVDIPRYI